MAEVSVDVGSQRDVLGRIKARYVSGEDNLGTDFFAPCLSRCVEYDRAAGFFSSSALKVWSQALTRIVQDTVQIRLLISPELSVRDKEALSNVASLKDREQFLDQHADHILAEAMRFATDPDDVKRRLLLLAWMIANKQLEIRFAIPSRLADQSMFHDKSGIFRFDGDRTIAFAGSANESFAAYAHNFERVLVFRSWQQGDREHLQAIQKDFEHMWDGAGGSLVVRPLSEEALARVRAVAPNARPFMVKDEGNGPQSIEDQWRHQLDAKKAYLLAGNGVLEMATGTGKTRTALSICDELLGTARIAGIVIAVDGTDLLDQWAQTLLGWIRGRRNGLRLYRQYAEHHEVQAFALSAEMAVLVVSRSQLSKLFAMLPASRRGRLLIVHDEVHGLGAPQMRHDLTGQHSSFAFRLGLSATPEREYDQEGTEFIEQEVGPVVFRFPVEQAIRNGILSEFDYIPLPYHLTDDDRARLRAVYSKQAARQKAGTPMSKEEVWIELARVYKTAEEKPAIFAEFLRSQPETVKGTIIFVEEKRFGDLLLPILAGYTDRYRTYYAEDERDNLLKFAAGRIDCLVTCHRISQGIDIKSLRTVVLFASARSKLETIQRIGRCLRVDPMNRSKRAMVVDFVRADDQEDREFESADAGRAKWLAQLSQCRRSVSNAD